jgi:hypothetical protein
LGFSSKSHPLLKKEGITEKKKKVSFLFKNKDRKKKKKKMGGGRSMLKGNDLPPRQKLHSSI